MCVGSAFAGVRRVLFRKFGNDVIIAFEGIDGSGKATVLDLVAKRLAKKNVAARAISFPRYGETHAAQIISAFLDASGVCYSPYYMASAFALDRHESLSLLKEEGDCLLADRYVASNAAFQAARMAEEDRAGFMRWLIDYEINRLGVPAPAVSIHLKIDVEVAAALIEKKAARSYTDKTFDAYERDRAYQTEVARMYERIGELDLFSNWRVVEVTRAGALRAPEDIADEAAGLIEAHATG